MAHNILSFTFKDQQDRGKGCWKLNASVLNDKDYKAMVRRTKRRQTKLRERKMVGCLPYLYPIQNRLFIQNKNMLSKIPQGTE